MDFLSKNLVFEYTYICMYKNLVSQLCAHPVYRCHFYWSACTKKSERSCDMYSMPLFQRYSTELQDCSDRVVFWFFIQITTFLF